jgi:bifunctional UDP-N-acetylglucosamine pyrophosphorylase/glucosamine-1-phosphate N-acetyltransferase
MKAIIMAAGLGTRTRPLTQSIPKAMLPIANKPILEHNIESVAPFVDEIVVIVGYLKERIISYFEDKEISEKLRFIYQEDKNGTGGAVLLAEEAVLTKEKEENSVIVMNGDDLFYPKDIERLAKGEYGILCRRVEDPSKFGILKCDKDGRVIEDVEKPKEFIGDLAAIGAYKLPCSIFSSLKEIGKSNRGEYELPSAINKLVEQYEIKAVEARGYWLPINYPWSLLEANKEYIKVISEGWEDNQFGNVKGKVKVGKNTEILPGAYIEGPVIIGDNCKIGPNCYIRPFTSIGNNCHIGNGCEIKNSIIMNNSNVAHLSYVGDSIIGEKCNLGAGTIIANLRHDGKNIEWEAKGELMDTERRKLGAIIANNVKTGIGTMIYPGRTMTSNTSTKPGEIVKKNIK